jgi:Cobalamin adenosyltransferase
LPDGSYGRPLAGLTLSEDERETLVRWSRRSASARNLAQRCRIVLGCADGKPRPGAPRTIGDEQIDAVVVATLERTPKNATHWPRASMAAESGLSESTVGRIWKAFNLKPHQVDTFKLFDVGADLSTPVKASKNGGAAADGDGKQDAITPLRITQDYVDRLERDCDEYNAVVTKLRSFILPGGTRSPHSCTWPAAPSAPPDRRWTSTATASTR